MNSFWIRKNRKKKEKNIGTEAGNYRSVATQLQIFQTRKKQESRK